ncbi:hypothetical protein Rs2_49352 [Raphanus sativus]|nr:hypothetical protein Rs2_49352 [Raphanus sativus]
MRRAGSRLVVRAADEAAPGTSSSEGAPATDVAPAGAACHQTQTASRSALREGPRRESYWFKNVGAVVAVDQDPKTRVPCCGPVRGKVNYANISTNNYALGRG